MTLFFHEVEGSERLHLLHVTLKSVSRSSLSLLVYCADLSVNTLFWREMSNCPTIVKRFHYDSVIFHSYVPGRLIPLVEQIQSFDEVQQSSHGIKLLFSRCVFPSQSKLSKPTLCLLFYLPANAQIYQCDFMIRSLLQRAVKLFFIRVTTSLMRCVC